LVARARWMASRWLSASGFLVVPPATYRGGR
jgi:hypothetical protein